MARAIIGTTMVAEASDVVLVEGNRYFPPADVRRSLLTKGTGQHACPWKGKATYWDINVEGKVYQNAAWSYEAPEDAAKGIAGYVAFDTSVVTVGE